jgi:hypothetical protein
MDIKTITCFVLEHDTMKVFSKFKPNLEDEIISVLYSFYDKTKKIYSCKTIYYSMVGEIWS